jgi:hypothetical protein
MWRKDENKTRTNGEIRLYAVRSANKGKLWMLRGFRVIEKTCCWTNWQMEQTEFKWLSGSNANPSLLFDTLLPVLPF